MLDLHRYPCSRIRLIDPFSWQRRVKAAICWAALALAIGLPVKADQVALIASDTSAVEMRVALVIEAEQEILVSTFIVGHEPFSLTALALLRERARQGIDVRLLVDAQWNKMPESVEAHLIDEGVKIKLFHPLSLCHPLWITKRLHDKLMIVDGEKLILGGRNIEGPYFGFGQQLSRRNYVDLDLEVVGESAGRSRDYFLEVWNSRHTRISNAKGSVTERLAASRELDTHADWLVGRGEERLSIGKRESEVQRSEVGEVRFLHDPPNGKGTGPGVATELLELLEAARESVVIESPYLIPTRKLRRALAAAVERGVKVRILTNSLTTTDNLWAQAGYVGVRRKLARLGVELWEYQGPESIHTKAGILDGRTVIVGSFNLDPRSASLNTEVAVVFESVSVAKEVHDFLDDHVTRAHRIDERGWPVDSLEPFPGVARKKVLKLRLLQLFAPLIRSQL